jgi:hypothetical protein
MRVSTSRLAGIPTTPARELIALAVLLLVVTPNLWLAARSVGLILGGEPAVDWQQYVEASHRVWAGGNLYEVAGAYGFRYSPLFAGLMTVLAPLGVVGWRLLHFAAAIALPTWPMRLLVLASWPFWYDVQTGNLVTFVVLAAAWALRGSRVGTAAFLLMTMLVPRPLMIPVAAWLLWRRPWSRLPFAIALVAQAGAVLALGWASGWLGMLVNSSTETLLPSNVGPSRFIGYWWIVIGIPVAVWLTVKGRVGWAALAANPYWLPYYLLMPVLELGRPTRVKIEARHREQDQPLAAVLGQRNGDAERHQPRTIR